MKILMICLVFLLVGCASQTDSDKIKIGNAVQAPYGYVDLCKREPVNPACGDKK